MTLSLASGLHLVILVAFKVRNLNQSLNPFGFN